ncbi:sugar metabolism transcriptional regulator [bacterium endosymbiont of Escarpia laminata]|nr:MAG: sugar metabolism transcriptional regulator [bacterium endosymbiont of Escarpia laminata]RLJ22091.1 MAG: sugar metabolism transcriptional regulator [bacterium endosymbiont of Escarpia laminata]
MILADIKRYLMARKQASLADIAMHFDADPDAVRGMLEHWIRKGRVEKHSVYASCGSSCDKCDPATTEVYSWGDSGDAVQVVPVEFNAGCPGE